MKVSFKVTVTVQDTEGMPRKEFLKEDGKDMIGYVQDCIEDRLKDCWLNAAKVSSAKVTRIRKTPKRKYCYTSH